MTTTLIGVFDDFAVAQNVVQELARTGVQPGDVQIAKNDHPHGYATYGGSSAEDASTGSAIQTTIDDHFADVLGSDVDDETRGVYAESVRRGSTVVTARVDDTLVDRAVETMSRAGAVDVDRRAAYYHAGGYTDFDAGAPQYSPEQTEQELRTLDEQKEIALPVIEESLLVGKRVVQRGGVRVHSRVTERPVEETVTLREESVHVERRPIDRDATEADLSTASGAAFEVTATGEEAVVSKQAKVVEEVAVGRQIAERDEVVRDTVRRTDVDVEHFDGDTQTPSER